MKIKDIFLKDIFRPINGVVKADQHDEAIIWQELDEYVITKELDKYIRQFFAPYCESLISTNDPVVSSRIGVWVSGFFGSGKSHFIKILSYILANEEVHDPLTSEAKKPVEFFQDKIKDAMLIGDIKRAAEINTDVLLFNIDSKADSVNDSSKLLSVFWKVFNEMQGFCSESLHIAKVEQYLTNKGKYTEFCQTFKDIYGSDWHAERDAYSLIKDETVQAISKVLEKEYDDVEKWLDKSESELKVTVEGFANNVKEYLDSKGPDHRVIFLVDEVGQFIGDDTRLMLNLQTLTEDLGRICKGRAWLIVTSQEDIDSVLGDLKSTKVNDFSKIQGRFNTRLSLSSANTDEVIHARLIQKNDAATHELEELFKKKGDIIKNQLCFANDNATIKSYKDETDFAANYPFVPYHFQLVQKIFESIRKVGASGLHLSRGERSMLDAFRSAAIEAADKDVGALVPLYDFYPCIESFLDTAVKRSIDQANENDGLEKPFDVKLLQTLFLIRYVDIIKPKIENLVTLCIDQVDCDRIELKRQIEASLQRLEKENLIRSNGDLFYFLTNDEIEVAREIKNVEISSSDETKLISEIIFDEILKGKYKHKYTEFKRDYSFNRICDSQIYKSSSESDITVEMLTPFSDQYNEFDERRCFAHTAEHEDTGRILVKLPDNKDFASELRTYIKTDKYRNQKADAAASPVLKKILDSCADENRSRKTRLVSLLDNLIVNADFYALGHARDIQSEKAEQSINTALDYIISEIFTKFKLIPKLHDEPIKEIKALLNVNDISKRQLQVQIDDNTTEIKEVIDYLDMMAIKNHPVILNELVARFNSRPYGWPDFEIALIIARLLVAGTIQILIDNTPVDPSDAVEPLTKSAQWKNIKIKKCMAIDKADIDKAKKLAKELFGSIGPDAQDELHKFLQNGLAKWVNDLKSYRQLASTGNYPGLIEIDTCMELINRIFGISDSYEFIKAFSSEKNQLLDAADDMHDLSDFYNNQRTTWEILCKAAEEFKQNREELGKDESASTALKRLYEIRNAQHPYKMLNEVTSLISKVKTVNDKLIEEKRNSAIAEIDKTISQVNDILKDNNAESELNDTALSGLNEMKDKIKNESSIPHITHLLCMVDYMFREALEIIESAGKEDDNTPTKEVKIIKPAGFSSKAYLETEEDVHEYVNVVKDELISAVKNNQRIRIL